MMNFKNHNGFTLIEVMIAVAIMGLLLSPLFVLQSSVMNTVSKYSQRLVRVLAGQAFFGQIQLERALNPKLDKETKKIDDPESTFEYSFDDIDEKSKLAKFKDVGLKEVLTKWNSLEGPQEEALISFIFDPEQEK